MKTQESTIFFASLHQKKRIVHFNTVIEIDCYCFASTFPVLNT
jgi:hypothetical protein